MATPTITRASRTSNNDQNSYWANFTTGTPSNNDPQMEGSNTNIYYHLLEVTGTDYTYKELFDALADYSADSDNIDFTVTYTNFDDSGLSDPLWRAQRIIDVQVDQRSGGDNTQTCVIVMLKTGTLRHELTGGTVVRFGENVWMPVIAAPATPTYTAGNQSTSTIGWGDSGWTAHHRIELGYVKWEAPPTMGNYTGSIQPVDQGDPRKDSTPSSLALAHCFIAPAAGQRLTVTNSRLTLRSGYTELNHEASKKRFDIDIAGVGLINASILVEKDRTTDSQSGFCHIIHQNPLSSMQISTVQEVDAELPTYGTGDNRRWYEGDLAIQSGRIWRCTSTASAGIQETPSTSATNWEAVSPTTYSLSGKNFTNREYLQVDGAVELFSSMPSRTADPYFLHNTRKNPIAEVTAQNYGGDGGNIQAAFHGSNQFGGSDQQTNQNYLVLRGVKANRMRYFKSGDALENIAWIDPPFNMDSSTATPFERAEDFGYAIYCLRSVGVYNRDASGSVKSTPAVVFGNQARVNSAVNGTDYQAFFGTDPWIETLFPQPLSVSDTGQWQVSQVDHAGTGTEQQAGLGAHYLHDFCVKRNSTGGAATDYARYLDANNESWLLHYGGIHRFSQNQSLRSTSWNFNSLGATGVTYNNDIDDVPGLSSNCINFFDNLGLLGVANGAQTIATGTNNSTLVIDGLSNFTAGDAECIEGATFVIGSATCHVLAATPTADGSGATLTVNTSSSTNVAVTDNLQIRFRHVGYTWNINASGIITISVDATTTISWNYSALSALTHAKMLLLLQYREANHSTNNPNFSSTQDSTWGGGSTAINALLHLVTNVSGTDASYVKVNTTASTTLDVSRFTFSVPAGSSMQLRPDQHCTRLNWGSTYSQPDRVTHTGSRTDVLGTTSVIELDLPSGTTATEIKASVAYQAGAGNTWNIGARPSIENDPLDNRNYLVVTEAQSHPTNNTDDVWYLAITGPEIQDSRSRFVGGTAATVTLLANQNYVAAPTGTTKRGNVEFRPCTLTNVGLSNEALALTVASTYNTLPWSGINASSYRAALYFSVDTSSFGYDDGNDPLRIRHDILQAKNDTHYSDLVARYGANPGGELVTANDIRLSNESHRIYINDTSRAQYLYFDDAIPTKSSYYVHYQATSDDVFFGVPTFSSGAVQSVVDQATDSQTTTLRSHISDAALGIP